MLEHLKDFATDKLSFLAQFMGEGYEVKGNAVVQKKAQDALRFEAAEMQSILPYQSYEEEIFVNKNSYGFGFEVAPMSGADESFFMALSEVLKTHLPDEVFGQCLLVKHDHIGAILERGFAPFYEKGGVYAEIANKWVSYHAQAAKEGYPNFANVSASLCDYRVFIFFSAKKGHGQRNMIEGLSARIKAELSLTGLSLKPLNAAVFSSLLQMLIAPDDEFYWPNPWAEADADLMKACLKPQTSTLITDEYLTIETTEMDGRLAQKRIVNCGLYKYPKQFAIWQNPDLFANLYKAQKSISCPFVISLSFIKINQTKAAAMAKSKSYNLQKSNNGIQNFINPFLQDEIADWTDISESLQRDEMALMECSYNLMLYCNQKDQDKHVAEAAGCYREFGFELKPARCTQWLRFLLSMPFMGSEGLWKGMQALGDVATLSNCNVASLMPLVSDFKGSVSGLIMPTYRNQLAFLDNFDDESLPITNYNYLTSATPGAGKSFLEQGRIMTALAMGEQVFVVDIGDSYKHLCHMLGGVYVDASTVALNPFSLFDFEGLVVIDEKEHHNYDQIRDLIAIMASPKEPLHPVQMDYLLNAVLVSWESKKNEACIDDVIEALKTALPAHDNDWRLRDLITLLGKYGTNGIYGHVFNGKTPNFSKQDLVVFELGSLAEKKDLLAVVTYAMIVIIQGQFYQGSRERKKRCLLDEAWRHITEGDNPTAASFISQGFRTA